MPFPSTRASFIASSKGVTTAQVKPGLLSPLKSRQSSLAPHLLLPLSLGNAFLPRKDSAGMRPLVGAADALRLPSGLPNPLLGGPLLRLLLLPVADGEGVVVTKGLRSLAKERREHGPVVVRVPVAPVLGDWGRAGSALFGGKVAVLAQDVVEDGFFGVAGLARDGFDYGENFVLHLDAGAVEPDAGSPLLTAEPRRMLRHDGGMVVVGWGWVGQTRDDEGVGEGDRGRAAVKLCRGEAG